MPTLKIATYNIHKGLSYFKRRVVLHELRERLRELDADIVFLQEVQGEHTLHGERYHNYPEGAQHEFIAQEVWPHSAYGRNAVYEAGHHGNAILSRYPILQSFNMDVSAHRFESRGLLHSEIELPGQKRVHCLCVHFGLFARGRRSQTGALIEYVRNEIPPDAPLIIAGDFNDWRNQTGRILASELHIHDVFHMHGGRLARSFPSRLPVLRLDRIYARGFEVQHSSVHTGGNWQRLSDHAALSAQLEMTMANIHRVAENQLMLLKNGAAFFPQLCAALDAAQHSVYLETYIFSGDETGRMVADALQRAAARGVTVRVLLDGYGSAELPRHLVDELRNAKVQVQWFRREISPFTMQRSRMRRLRRLHRKLAVLDGEVAFVGGINVINDISSSEGFDSPRLDYAVRVQGGIAREIHATMRRLWGMVSWANFRRRGKELRRFVRERGKPAVEQRITLLLRDNLRHRHDIENAYLDAIAGAQREIIIANAYFLPRSAFRQALVQAAQRGVRVMLLLQGRIEYRVQHYATHALYDQLLAGGVEIYEYQPSYLHAKVAVVDGEWATVGSSNIDPYSLLLALEANLAVRDQGFAGELRASLLDAIAGESARIGEGYGVSRNWIDRMIARFSYMIVRMLIGLLGYSKTI
ncbi:MAG TPA: cardiolipin synthase ClsB [Gallionella sp.]|nr:cardiolipin synthase ClsB [Gallionella sp.]